MVHAGLTLHLVSLSVGYVMASYNVEPISNTHYDLPGYQNYFYVCPFLSLLVVLISNTPIDERYHCSRRNHCGSDSFDVLG